MSHRRDGGVLQPPREQKVKQARTIPKRCLMLQLRIAITAGLYLFTLTGCFVQTVETGPVEHASRSIPLDKTELVNAEIRMGAGELKIRGGSAQLVDADFTYNAPTLKPEVRYDATGFRGRLQILQPGSDHHHNLGHSKYEWDLRFNDATPLSLNIHFGAGNAQLDLGSLSLDNLEVNMGVGNLNLDLKGTPKKDYHVSVHGGVGNATVYLPDGVGVSVEAHGGLGSIEAHDLHKEGSRYRNDAFENHAKVNVRLEIHGGIGNIRLIGG